MSGARNARGAGLTLLELLVALLFVGVLAVPGVLGLLRLRDGAALDGASHILTAALRDTRSAARRESRDGVLGWSEDGAVLLTGAGERRLPDGVVLARVTPAARTFAFRAPHGRAGAVDTEFELRSRATGRRAIVRVVGVTGKVVALDR